MLDDADKDNIAVIQCRDHRKIAIRWYESHVRKPQLDTGQNRSLSSFEIPDYDVALLKRFRGYVAQPARMVYDPVGIPHLPWPGEKDPLDWTSRLQTM